MTPMVSYWLYLGQVLLIEIRQHLLPHILISIGKVFDVGRLVELSVHLQQLLILQADDLVGFSSSIEAVGSRVEEVSDQLKSQLPIRRLVSTKHFIQHHSFVLKQLAFKLVSPAFLPKVEIV